MSIEIFRTEVVKSEKGFSINKYKFSILAILIIPLLLINVQAQEGLIDQIGFLSDLPSDFGIDEFIEGYNQYNPLEQEYQDNFQEYEDLDPYHDSGSIIGSKIFKIWVGDKNSINLPGAEVSVDGISKGITDSNGEVRTEVSFGQHIVSASAECGESSKNYDFNEAIDGVSLTIDSCPAEQTKIFKIWVGDKNSINLPGAEVSVDGISKGITDSNGEVRTEVSFGQHTVSARAECGESSRNYEFNEAVDGVSLTIDSCPAEQTKIFKIWVGDKNSINLPGAEVSVDGISKGITDSNGEVRTEVSFGQHTVSARAECGESSRNYDFNEAVDGVSLTIDSCPVSGQNFEIVFSGTAIEFKKGTMPGAPDYWTVSVDKLISGPQPNTAPIDVVIGQSISPPIWGSVDKSIEAGDKVEVYGSYVTDDKGCRVTLHGSESFYFKKAACSGVVRGHVRDAQTDQPIEGASLECNLYCNGPVTTDVQGYYELGSPACNICGMVYCSVTCSADGYEQQVQSLVTDVDGNGEKDLDFYLLPKKVSFVIVQGEVIETPHCSPAGSRPDYYANVRIKKVVQNPDKVPEIFPGSIITVRGKECSSVNDLVKGRCYEFQGDWSEGALWIIFSNVKRIDCASNSNETQNPDCGEILKYDISNGKYAIGQMVLADMEYRSNLNLESDFQGVLLLRSPNGDIYSNSKIERTPPYGTDQFGYWNRGNQIDVRIPENAAEGWYSAKLQLINQDIGNICDETEWLERQFEIYQPNNGSTNNCSEIKLKGTCLEVKDLCWGSSSHKLCEIWVVEIEEVVSGQKPDVDVVEVYSGLPSIRGFHDENIQAGGKVEVYGCGNGNYISIAAEERYYIRRISASPCLGVISGHVFNAKTGLPIKGAGICDDQDPDVCNVCYTTNDSGYYAMGPMVGQDSGCHFCPNSSYRIRVYNAECYNISDNASSTRTLITDESGNARDIDFELTPIKCRSSQCEKLQTYGPIRTDKCGNKYQAHNTCKCKGCNCVCDNLMVEERTDRKNSKPVVIEFSGPGQISIGKLEQFTLVGEDKDGDQFYFEIDWRDGTKTMTFLASSRESVKVSHTWRSVDCLEEVRARAIDICGGPDGTSDWEYININIKA